MSSLLLVIYSKVLETATGFCPLAKWVIKVLLFIIVLLNLESTNLILFNDSFISFVDMPISFNKDTIAK